MDNILPGQLTPYQQEYRNALKTLQNGMTDYGNFQNTVNFLKDIVTQKENYAKANGEVNLQNNAHEAAEVAREAAKRNNVDTSVIDNLNANQARAYIQGLENEAKAKFLYRKTPEQLNAQLTQQYLQSGLPKEKAIERAYYDTMPYAAQYAAEGKMLFGDRGTTDNAVNTNYGVPLMMLLSDTAPEVAQIAAATNALPKDNWTADQRIRQMFTAGDIASGQSAQQYKQNLGLLGARIAGQRQLNQDKYAADLDKLITGANLNMQAMERQYSLMSEAQRAQVDYFAKGFKNAGYSDGEAWAMAIGLVGGGNNKQLQEKGLTNTEKNKLGDLGVAIQKLFKENRDDRIDISEYSDIVAGLAQYLDADTKQTAEDIKNLAEFERNYNYDGIAGAGKEFSNTIKQAQYMLAPERRERFLKLAKELGLDGILNQYEKRDVNKPREQRQ